ncbi:MAG: Rrf2 family transcriptional regulator [Candidatus Omnitrophica bacterium]|nr:Rrf2 family transcriptional regulator [Candidatus Omnitrophota bacterium]
MKLSTKGRYGTRLMLDLALRYGNGPILLRDIAGRQEISEKYLGQLVTPLKVAGLINSIRGAHGGYMLAKEPSEITLKEVIQSLEGSLSLSECIDVPRVCQRVSSCVTRDILEEMSEKMIGVLESTTLQDMISREKQKSKLQPLTYSI